jgi:hypothetical protein
VSQAGALDHQTQQLSVDGVDPPADLVQRRRRLRWLGLGHFLPQKRRIAT